MSETYDYGRIEPEWQRRWAEADCFRAAAPGEAGSEKPPFYVLDMFPYPSGAGLHVGHPLGYIASDIVSRYKRMRGFNVLHPMGWDAFGLPAEQYAIETGIHPAITTRKNIETYKRQLKIIGLSYDWSREVATCDERYYRWTQWIFLKIYNSWYDPEYRWTDAGGREVTGAARPIEQLPIPQHVKAEGDAAVAQFRDEHRLAYLAEVPVNWCPALGTVLSNEEVTADGRSERGNHPVYRRPMKQWMLRITEYADRLLADLDGLEWPEPIKLMQRAWIGRSEGAYIDFKLDGAEDVIRVYSTRPDTLYGATYLVLAPEHRLVNVITTDAQRGAVEAYVREARQKSDLARTAESKVKTGVFTGGYAINPVNHARLPIWVADYVLGGYGTGSIMAVPGSDRRDLEFADTFGLPVVQVVQPPAGVAWRGFEDLGVAVNSPPLQTEPGHPVQGERFAGQCDLNGLPTPEAKAKITTWLEERDLGEGTVQYKLRDWLFSRQRYWGEPFPIVYDERGLSEAVPENDLPVVLPAMDDFKPTASDNPDAEPQTPLSRAAEWTTLERGGRKLRRELNTMPQWAGSCWYYLRFTDASNDKAMIDPGVERYWAQQKAGGGAAKSGFVDLYLGGAEHAVLHLLYARFWHKVLYDLHVVSTPEPFQKLFNQGMIGAPSYRDDRGVYAPAAEVTEGPETEMFHPEEVDSRALQAALARGLSAVEAGKTARVRVKTKFYYAGQPVLQTFDKMSKTKKNVVNPDEIIGEYGADTLRLYEMYMGPLDASKPWNTRDIVGVHRFLQRVWRLVVVGDGGEGWKLNPRLGETRNDSLEKLLHKTIKKVETDIEAFAFNTAIAQMIVWVNEATGAETIGRDQIERFLRVLCPFAPHMCEELFARLGGTTLLSAAAWPAYDEALTRDDTVEIAVQVKGKVRGRVTVPTGATDDEIVAAARAVDAVAKDIAGRTIQRAIVVKGRLVNLIVQ
ncbi:MAG: leucine--tRNA ligase [Phycisphaerales bacterium]|nr:leucine--tRNA ligase [Phycisphaerales bacterium]